MLEDEEGQERVYARGGGRTSLVGGHRRIERFSELTDDRLSQSRVSSVVAMRARIERFAYNLPIPSGQLPTTQPPVGLFSNEERAHEHED